MERDSETLVGALDQIQAGNLDSGYAQLEELWRARKAVLRSPR